MLTNEQLEERLGFLGAWHALPGRPLFIKVWGSYSHNCAYEKSDLDMLAVYQMPTTAVLSLRHFQETINWSNANGAPFDMECHEVGKFCGLVLKGGPAALETLFTDRLMSSTPAFDRLRGMANKFLSKRAVRQYLGYADGQLRKLEHGQSLHTKGGKMSEKWSYHFSRLIDDAKRVALGQPPLVWKDGIERDELMKIRSGETTAATALARAKDQIAKIREMESDWQVSDEPDEDAMSEWLVETRLMCPSLKEA